MISYTIALTNKRSLLSIENLISAIDLLIQRDDIRNQVFLVADATPVSLPEIITSLRHGMGRPANLFGSSCVVVESFSHVPNVGDMGEACRKSSRFNR